MDLYETYKTLRNELKSVCMLSADKNITDEEYEQRWSAYFDHLHTAEKRLKPGHEWRMRESSENAILHYIQFCM